MRESENERLKVTYSRENMSPLRYGFVGGNGAEKNLYRSFSTSQPSRRIVERISHLSEIYYRNQI